MGHGELRRSVEQVTKSLAPSRIEIQIEDKDVLHIFVVSEQFEGMPLSRRFEQLSDLFESEGTPIAEEFTLIFQAWTKAELAEIEAGLVSGVFEKDE